MNRCPITYELCEGKYSEKGLKLLSKSLKELNDFPYTSKEQIELAARFETKLSIQGIQPKLSTRLNLRKQIFEIVEKNGRYIFKPPHHLFEEVPQNEDLSMRLASIVNIEVPLHGMIYNIDGTLSYFIKRFDRSQDKRLGVEDFSQLLGFSRDTKYESSMEQIIAVIDQYCTFPQIEKIKLFRLTIFNFLIGNEDMHLKNFSLLKREGGVYLSPAYDLLNTTLVMKATDEVALPIRGKKRKLGRKDLVDYFGVERLKLPLHLLSQELDLFERALPIWYSTIENSFLSPSKQEFYTLLVKIRAKKLFGEERTSYIA